MIETKVIAATAGGASGGVVGTFLLWVGGVLLWGVPADAAHSTAAVAAVPSPVSAFLFVALAAAGSFVGGYFAPHTSRPDLPATPAAPAPVVAAVHLEAAPAPAPVAPAQVVPDPAPVPELAPEPVPVPAPVDVPLVTTEPHPVAVEPAGLPPVPPA